jgi:hypothetical protein
MLDDIEATAAVTVALAVAAVGPRSMICMSHWVELIMVMEYKAAGGCISVKVTGQGRWWVCGEPWSAIWTRSTITTS